MRFMANNWEALLALLGLVVIAVMYAPVKSLFGLDMWGTA